jgi:hypothetical protein
MLSADESLARRPRTPDPCVVRRPICKDKMKTLRDALLLAVLPLLAGSLTWIVIGRGGGLAILGGLLVGFIVTCVAFFAGLYAAMHFSDKDEQEKQDNETVDEMSRLVRSSEGMLSSLPELLRGAERSLDTAAKEFAERAFAPFWDEVEKAATRLATFHNTIRQVGENAEEHQEACERLSGRIRSFQVRPEQLPNPRPTASRMREIVRMAQKDFQFATIYEHRKANQLHVVGFSTLDQTISEIGSRLDTAVEVLDNIQRRRMPIG